ncbi:MAG TPA: SRPBCC domain-containing protein [Cyclobacteriaceae bacterium]|jgi:hypothetical protein|nr:SRPBCC domain-containing protein [Cyclobacteriaceae bacterium]
MKYLTTIVLVLIFNSIANAKEIKTEVLINASPEKVWAIFSDFENYPTWNPFIKSLTGQVKVGDKVHVTIQPYDSKPISFKPKVLVFETNKEMRWIGRLLFGGLFDGKHRFELIDNGNGTTTFKQSEVFKGILMPFFNKKKMENTRKGYEAMNQKLKELAEQK